MLVENLLGFGRQLRIGNSRRSEFSNLLRSKFTAASDASVKNPKTIDAAAFSIYIHGRFRRFMRIEFVVVMLTLTAVLANADSSFETAAGDAVSRQSQQIHKTAVSAAAAAGSSHSKPKGFDWRTVTRPKIGIGAEYTKPFKDGWDEMINVLAHSSNCAKFFAENGHPAEEVGAVLAATDYKVYSFVKGEESIGAKTLGPADVEINADGLFLTAKDGKISLNRQNYDLFQLSNVRGMILLHELGHELGIFPADRGNAELNAHHSLTIIQNCFPMYSRPKQN